MRYILALDQGTTSSRAIVFDEEGAPVAIAQQEFRQIYPAAGLGRARPERDLSPRSARWRARRCEKAGIEPDRNRRRRHHQPARDHRACGTARPASRSHNAIVWQDRRTAPMCSELRAQGVEPLIREKTGLVLDPYFSGTKIAWLLDNIPGARARAERGELAFGTIDTWLIWQLSESRTHVTDPSNASRTMLFDIHKGDWDDELLRILRVPRAILPDVHPSAHVFGMIAPSVLGAPVPIAGIAGDQQAALFGQGCLKAGHGEEHLRHRLLHAAAHRRARRRLGQRPAHHRRRAARRHADAGVRAGRQRVHRRRGGAVAARRDCASSSRAPRSRRWPPACPTTAASTWCRPSPAWARRTGTR